MKRYISSARIGRQKEVYVTQEYVPDYGWEDICVYDDTSRETFKEASAEVLSYIENGYGARVINRRIPNPDYVEPTNELTGQMVKDYFTGDKESLILDTPYTSGRINYLIGYPKDYQHRCQVFVTDEGKVYVYNINTKRSKQVYTLDQLESAINKILNG